MKAAGPSGQDRPPPAAESNEAAKVAEAGAQQGLVGTRTTAGSALLPERKRPGSGAGGAEADTRGMPANPSDLVKVKTLKQSKKE